MTTEAESTSVFSFSALIVVLLFAVGVLLLVYFTWYQPNHNTSSTYIERNTTVTTPGETNQPAEQPDTNTNINVAPSPAPDTAPAPEPGSAPNADTGSQAQPEPAPAQ